MVCLWCRRVILYVQDTRTWVHEDTKEASCGKVAVPTFGPLKPPPESSDSDTYWCSEHPNVALIHERGGNDMPTIHGRWYCPACQSLLFAALDAQEAR